MSRAVYYYSRHLGEIVALARIVYDDNTGRSEGHYANAKTSTWVAHPSIIGRATGLGGDADYLTIERDRALEYLADLGNEPDELDRVDDGK